MSRLTTTKKDKEISGTDRSRPVKTVKGLQLQALPRLSGVSKWTKGKRKLFTDCCRSLLSRNLLFEGDLPFLVAYCAEMDKYYTLTDKVGEKYIVTGSMGQEVVNPLLKVANQSLQNAIKLGKEFGFSPYSKRLVGEGIEIEEEDNDPMAKLLNGGKKR